MLIGMILLAILCLSAYNRMNDVPVVQKSSLMPLTHSQLFVEVKADTIAALVSNDLLSLHPSLKVRDLPRRIEIEYNTNAHILLDMTGNGMDDENKELEKSGIVVKDANKTKIVLKKHKLNSVQYVNCPAPILAEILRNKTKSENISR